MTSKERIFVFLRQKHKLIWTISISQNIIFQTVSIFHKLMIFVSQQNPSLPFTIYVSNHAS